MNLQQYCLPIKHIRLVFVDGILDEQHSDQQLLPHSLTIQKTADDSFVWQCAKNTRVALPIYCVYLFTKANAQAVQHTIHLAENSFVQIIEQYVAQSNSGLDSFAEVNARMDLARDAKLHYLKYQNLTENFSLTSHLKILQAQNSFFQAGFFSSGGKITETHLTVDQIGSHAESDLFGLNLPQRDGQIMTDRIQVTHQASFGISRMLYKGIVDQKARALFTGKVVVDKHIEKIQAMQANHHLLLSPQAFARSQPELEIDSEDVKCAHGSTVGQLDAEALFYLQARGIPADEAKQLLIAAFAGEVFSQIHDADVSAWLQQQVMCHA